LILSASVHNRKLSIAVHKFTSCDGCQLAFLNAEEALLSLFELNDVMHFSEAGPVDLSKKVDVAFVEGSISTPSEIERILKVRENSTFVIAIGACATAGGIQALRNLSDKDQWMSDIYATPQTIQTLKKSEPIAAHIKVDLEIQGCPIDARQAFAAIRSLMYGAKPRFKQDSVCLECKRAGNICVLVTKQNHCLGPVTQAGCGAICPSLNRACYGCFGPQENPNTTSLSSQFLNTGATPETVNRAYQHINSHAPAFEKAVIANGTGKSDD
jgi:coenzyme F420-reducing hydrogenase gamma subunit